MAVLCVAIVIGVGVGPVYIGPARVVETLWDGLMGNATTGTASTIVNDIRLPRVLVGAMVGAMMAMAGAILQGVTRNPLADPHILGVSAGAGLVAVAGIVFLPNLSNPYLDVNLPLLDVRIASLAVIQPLSVSTSKCQPYSTGAVGDAAAFASVFE